MVSCNNTKKENKDDSTNVLVISNDLETARLILRSWKLEYSVLKTENPQAHSGEYVVTLNDTIEFGYTFREVLKNIDNRIPIMVKYRAYVYSTTPNPKVSIICDIEKDSSRFLRKSILLEKTITTPNEWVEFSEIYHFDKDILDTNMIINIFPWNYGKEQKVLIDDIEITFIYEPKTEFDLGNVYYNGDGVEKDYAKAMKYYRKAAKQGNAEAQNKLGEMYILGQGVKIDNAEAMKWFRKAAKQDNDWAQTNLGIIYYEGYGVEIDYMEAIKWYRKAAEKGNYVAQIKLGNMYCDGYGVEKDYKEAIKWFRKAAEQDIDVAQYNLGIMYYNG